MKSLADVMSASGLEGYAEVALVLFFIVFVAIAFRVLLAKERDLDRAARMPLDDDATAATPANHISPARPEDAR